MATTSIPVTGMPRAFRREAMSLPVVDPDPSRLAVLLNKNARKVTDSIAKRVERVVGRDHVFYSHSIEEAEAFSREIVQRGYGTVLSGGGDGTLAQTFNLVQRYIDESNDWRIDRALRFGERQALLGSPRFGFLRLGTGNGMTQVVGASDPLRDLERLVEDGAPGTHHISLIQQGSDRFFFGGLGYDSMLLNDYNELKRAKHHPWFRPFTQGLAGYFTAMFMRTLPTLATRGLTLEGHVVNRGRAYYVDPRRGDAAIEIEPGATLFEGKAAIISAGTSPYYGYGFRIFPFSNIMPGMMHLRIATMSAARTLVNLPAVWRGEYRNPDRVFDFLVEDVSVELANPFPFQHSGDAQGMRDRLDLRIADSEMKLVDYHREPKFKA